MNINKKIIVLFVLSALCFSILLSFLIIQFVPLAQYCVRFYVDYEDAIKQTEIQYIETIRYATEQEKIEHNMEEIKMIAKTVWGEYRGNDKDHQAAVVWCILNRVDDGRFPDNITDVITQPNQFGGYKESNPVDNEIVELVKDVVSRWTIEQNTIGLVGRVLPKSYCWFSGNGTENYYRDSYDGEYDVWEWTLESPYKEG